MTDQLQTDPETQKHIRRIVISQARYMAWDDVKAHDNKTWNTDQVEQAALDYSRVYPWYDRFIAPSKDDREAFRCEYIARYHHEVSQARRKARGKLLRVQDFRSQLISCGGYIYTRKELYYDLISQGNGLECAEYFAYRPQEYKNGDW